MENTLPLSMPNAASPAYPTLTESWGAFGWHLLIVVGSTLLALALLAVTHVVGQGKLWLLLGASQVGLVFTMLWLRQRSGAARWPGLVLQELPTRWQLYALLPVLVLAQALLLTLLRFLHLPNWFAGTLWQMATYPALVAVAGCVLAPILEEALFRGILLKGLLRNYRPAVAIGQSALLFGLVHFNPAQSINALLIGLLSGWLYYRTRSLALCIAVHALHNSLSFGTIYLMKSQGRPDAFNLASWQQYWLALTIAGVVLSSIIWWVQRSTKPALAAAEEAPQLAPELT
jgi:membrane protease YdiL (CAAX protease family)